MYTIGMPRAPANHQHFNLATAAAAVGSASAPIRPPACRRGRLRCSDRRSVNQGRGCRKRSGPPVARIRVPLTPTRPSQSDQGERAQGPRRRRGPATSSTGGGSTGPARTPGMWCENVAGWSGLSPPPKARGVALLVAKAGRIGGGGGGRKPQGPRPRFCHQNDPGLTFKGQSGLRSSTDSASAEQVIHEISGISIHVSGRVMELA